MYLCIYVFMVVAAYCVSDLNQLLIIFAFLPIFFCVQIWFLLYRNEKEKQYSASVFSKCKRNRIFSPRTWRPSAWAWCSVMCCLQHAKKISASLTTEAFRIHPCHVVSGIHQGTHLLVHLNPWLLNLDSLSFNWYDSWFVMSSFPRRAVCE